MGKTRLRVLDIAAADSYAGSYILILAEYGGNRHLPVVLPPADAQAIVAKHEHVCSAKPLIHDLLFSTVSTFGIEMLEVNITKFENGIFSSDIVLYDGEKEQTFSCRVSDAIALALRFRCSIFAFAEVMELAGIVIDSELEEDLPQTNSSTADFKRYSTRELQQILDELIRNEEYEKATAVRDELRERAK